MQDEILQILYLGANSGTSLDRANAYRRMGHQVEHINLRKLLPATSFVDRITWRISGGVFSRLIINNLNKCIHGKRFDICHVDGGEWVTKEVIAYLRQFCAQIINYNHDDPFSKRDRQRFKAYRDSVSAYDLLIVVREENIQEALELGANCVFRIYRCADEVSHAPLQLTEEDRKNWEDDVLFLGTWMPERGQFLLRLTELGVPLSIRGANWHKAKEWDKLKKYYKGGELKGEEYAKAIQCAKVSLGLLSKGNRDLHTTRSAEIPALVGFFCAERTSEHTGMYIEGKEAEFWSTPEECAQKCLFALQNEEQRLNTAIAGNLKLKEKGFLNQCMLQNVLEKCKAIKS